MEDKFTEDDKKKVVDFLNYIAANANFGDMKYKDIIEAFKLLNYMQSTLLPKIDANILEVVQVVEVEKEDKEE